MDIIEKTFFQKTPFSDPETRIRNIQVEESTLCDRCLSKSERATSLFFADCPAVHKSPYKMQRSKHAHAILD